MAVKVINHDQRLPMAILRQDYLDMCGGWLIAALLLDVIEQWTDTLYNAAIVEETDPGELWFLHSYDQFQQEIVMPCIEPDIKKSITYLVVCGYIEQAPCDIGGYSEYRLRIEEVQKKIDRKKSSNVTPIYVQS
jgi:hypothetical protein